MISVRRAGAELLEGVGHVGPSLQGKDRAHVRGEMEEGRGSCIIRQEIE